jgi:hypothetical protein
MRRSPLNLLPAKSGEPEGKKSSEIYFTGRLGYKRLPGSLAQGRSARRGFYKK